MRWERLVGVTDKQDKEEETLVEAHRGRLWLDWRSENGSVYLDKKGLIEEGIRESGQEGPVNLNNTFRLYKGKLRAINL